MDLTKPYVDVMQLWKNTQQKMWTTWLSTLQGIGRSPTPDLRGRIIEVLEQSVGQMLETQAEWTRLWAETVRKTDGVPANLVDWASQTEEGMQKWHAAQKKLWDELVQVLRKAVPGTSPSALEQEALQVLRTWQDAAGEAMNTQLAWLSSGKKASAK